jgi:Na+-transporting NADH:ubiquinone oxidoreductase subunit F
MNAEAHSAGAEAPVVINDQPAFTVRTGQSLLAALRAKGIILPSACGGRGACGQCRVLVTAGGGEPQPRELAKLGATESAQGWRLACQIRIAHPIRLRLPPEILAIKPFTARVTALRDLTDDIKEIVLALIEPAAIQFEAGQHIQLQVPNAPHLCRAYSIASPPSQHDRIELEVRRVSGGICTTHIFERMQPGETVRITGPYGRFRLRPSAGRLLFVAGGSGLAPIKSILYDMAERGDSRATVFYFGARTARDLFYVDALHGLERQLSDFRFVPALSAPAPGDRWQGETGLISEVIKRRVNSVKDLDAYLCGSPAMIDACASVLRAKGLAPDAIHFDRFA